MTLRMRTSAAAFQSSFRAEAVAVAHHPLDRDARQLVERAEILERVREGGEAAGVEERPKTGLDPRGRAQLGVARPVGAERRRDVVVLGVGLDEAVDIGLRHALDHPDEIVDAEAVDREAEPGLRLDLVAFGDGDLAHVVAEPGDLELHARRASPGRRGTTSRAWRRRPDPPSARRSSGATVGAGSG